MDSGQIVRPELVDHQNAVPCFRRLYVGQAEPHCQRINGSFMSRCPDMPPPQNRAAAQSRRRCVAASTARTNSGSLRRLSRYPSTAALITA